MAVLLSPLGNGFQFLTTTGLPLSGGQIYTYQAGSSTPLSTYSDNGGTVPNANPIVLGVDGRPQTEIWLTQGFNYKFILTDSNNNIIQSYDNLYGILQTAPAVSNTVPSGLIAIWSGSIGAIPSGWVLCDGTNGAPDLRNSFILGAKVAKPDAGVFNHSNSLSGLFSDLAKQGIQTKAEAALAGKTGGMSILPIGIAKKAYEFMNKDKFVNETIHPHSGLIEEKP